MKTGFAWLWIGTGGKLVCVNRVMNFQAS